MKSRFQFFRKKDLLYLALFLLPVSAGMQYFERSNVWRPVRELRGNPADKGLAFEDVYFQASDGTRLNGWYFPAQESARASVLFCHGNGGNLGNQYTHVELLRPQGLNFFIFDYRGYGKSEGVLSETGTYRDALAAYHWLRQKTPNLPIVIHGWSLGSAIAIDLATQVKAAALISENGFTSIPAVGNDRYPFLPTSVLSWVRYNALSRIGRVNAPLLVIHSPDDAVVLYRHGEELYQAAKEPKTMKPLAGGHDCAFVSAEEYKQTIADFLDQYVFYKNSDGNADKKGALSPSS